MTTVLLVKGVTQMGDCLRVPLALPVPWMRHPARTGSASGTRFLPEQDDPRIHGVIRAALCLTRALSFAMLVVFATGTPLFAQTRDFSTAQWNKAVQDGRIAEGQVVSVEGRRAFSAERTVYLQRGLGSFRLSAESQDSALKGGRVRIRGTVVSGRKGNSGPTIRVDRLEDLKSEVQEFLARRRSLKLPTAKDWLDLAAWARDRGEFFHDSELIDLARDAVDKAIELDRKALPADAPAKEVADLVVRAEKLGASEAVVSSVRHESWVRRWQAATAAGPVPLSEFTEEFARAFPIPVATVVSAASDDDLFRRYHAQPVHVYDRASPDERMRLMRLVYAESLLTVLKSRLAPGGTNAFEVAAEIEQKIPEYAAVAESIRDEALAARAAEVEKLTRSEVLSLSDDYRQREQLDRARGILETWVTLRRKKLGAEDTEGLLEVAEDYRRLLSRDDYADRLLMETWARNKNPDLAEALEKRGYRLKESRWLTQAEYDQRPEGRLERALREGRIEVGMSATQVRQALGLPVRASRFVTAALVQEVWEYGSGGTRFLVQLSRRKNDAEMTVTTVGQ